MATIAEAIGAASELLRASSESPLLDTQLLLSHVLKRERPWLLAHGDADLARREYGHFKRLVERRAEGVPVAYLTQSAGFYGREFTVHSGVLVPRPETEHLVERALAEIDRAQLGGEAVRVLDVGTGSGAIAVTVACERPNLRVVATDRSVDALQVARTNAVRHGVARRVLLLCGDLHEPAAPHAPFDLVLANLPYVPTAALPHAPQSAGYEPQLALDGGDDGLALYRRLLPALPRLLREGGAVLMEAAPPTIAGLQALARAVFPGAGVDVVVDYGGRARVVCVLTREAGGAPRNSTTQSEPSSSHA
ncbi:peptide chain release factor N(5)-glutamine methyltransferase [bacterium]|nr:MAG: peptide chain release factor N(5)-glutamine methyltransferase [bacterium]